MYSKNSHQQRIYMFPNILHKTCLIYTDTILFDDLINNKNVVENTNTLTRRQSLEKKIVKSYIFKTASDISK